MTVTLATLLSGAKKWNPEGSVLVPSNAKRKSFSTWHCLIIKTIFQNQANFSALKELLKNEF